jgi:adenylate cyclase, class 1
MVHGQVNHVPLDNLPALHEYLGEELPAYSPIHLDPQALDDSDLSLIIPHGQPECIQVFYRVSEPFADLYVLDEHNALWHQRLPWHDEPSLLMPIQRFLQSLMYRRGALLPLDNPMDPQVLETLYYRITPDGSGRARRIEQRLAPVTQTDKPFYDVQAIVEEASPGEVNVTLYCDGMEFSELEFGEQLFSVVARQILERRSEPQRYRCYITDLDLSGILADTRGETILFLRYKAELEMSLNEAMALA